MSTLTASETQVVLLLLVGFCSGFFIAYSYMYLKQRETDEQQLLKKNKLTEE